MYARALAATNAAMNSTSIYLSGPNCFWSRMFYERASFETSISPALSPLNSGQIFNVTSATNAVARVTGSFKTSAAGTFGFIWGNTGTAGNNATVEAAGYLILTRIDV